MQSTTADAGEVIGREVAQPRVSGAHVPDVEAGAVFESIALSLLLNPRTSLWFAFLAKNGLQRIVQDELVTVQLMQKDVADLSNADLALQDVGYLQEARNSLLQLEQLSRVSLDSPQYTRFDSSVSNFLNRTVAPAVRRPGQSTLVRPRSEASIDLSTDFATLISQHADLTDRLYALLVGVDNFLTSPLSTLLGLSTVSRTRRHIENLISVVQENGSTPVTRDMVVQIITNRAAIKATSALPTLDAPVIDTVQSLPTGFDIKAASDPGPASTTTTFEGPYTLSAGASVTMSVGGTTLGPFTIPQSTTDLNNKAFIASTAVTYPVTLPADYYLFVNIDNVPYNVGPVPGGAVTASSLVTVLNGLFSSASAPVSGMHAEEFINAGTSRILLYHDTASALSLSPFYMDEVFGLFADSIHELIGFGGSEVGASGVTLTQHIVDSLSRLFGSLVTVTLEDPNLLTIETLTIDPGAVLTIAAPSELGLSGVFPAKSDSIRLYGTVNGVTTDPANPIGLVDIEDEVTTSTGISTIASVTDSRILLTEPIATFDGPIRIDSALVQAYRSLESILASISSEWFKKPFTENLNVINIALSSLTSGTLQSQKKTVLDLLANLETSLNSILSSLTAPAAILPATSASNEKSIVDGITNTLTERKFDRALDLFMRCKIQEALSCNAQTASYGGAFLSAASDFVTHDLVVPNRALGEQVEGTSSQPTKGL